MSIAITNDYPSAQRISRNLGCMTGKITFSSTYASGGEAMAAASLKLRSVKTIAFESESGYLFMYDKTNEKVLVYNPTAGAGASFTGTAIAGQNVDITHAAGAATTGVAVYLHTKDGTVGWLEFVSPTNADGVVRLNTTGAYVMVFDADAAATDGLAVYMDEDATLAVNRLMAVCPLATDVYVPCSNGQAVKVKYDAGAATVGVQVYCDEDATLANDRLMAVLPGSTGVAAEQSETYRAGLSPVDAGTVTITAAAGAQYSGTLALGNVQFFAIGLL